ncbi:hypothetical protein KP509_20G001500 [Ceratopteris richardii]|uniref:Xyloglucan endotransglucosylase/hydrolase n=1 Tax=Ceratopteris richardii TaxID=49495 RepID=A0A8T2SEI6_CERRI|nr:hypothetical protein KP509_20G001500 [Ceratopteris richardii]
MVEHSFTECRIAFCVVLIASMLNSCIVENCGAVDLRQELVVTWAPTNVRFEGGGEALQLVLENTTGGAGFASKNYYLLGNIDMQIKLVPGDSAGTVTAYYMSSETSNHDELDFEFLGNSSGEPYVLQTNVFSNGIGEREQRIFLWFDPTVDFHTYSIRWSEEHILFLVDGTPIRVFSNNKDVGVPYLDSQPMRVFSSIWNGDSWATRGGLVKIDWDHAPFIASYRGFEASGSACVATSSAACAAQVTAMDGTHRGPASLPLDSAKLDWVKRNFMVYDYCTDQKRNPVPPPECSREL